MKAKCKYCGYEWESRIRKPKACPACKRYFPLVEFQNNIDHRKEEQKDVTEQ